MALSKRQTDILKIVRSNKLFAKILQDILPDGESVPMKMGKKGMAPAFAKTDEAFQLLLTHSDEKVRDLCTTRQMVKSWPNHIKRIDNMVNQTICCNGILPVDLKYYGAHTGRWSGSGGVNLQNLGGRGRGGQGTDPLISAVRGLLHAPDGEIFLIADSAQIEARFLAWIAGQEDLTDGFKKGEDIYSVFATHLFNAEVRKPCDSDNPDLAKVLKIRRGFGKDGILGAGYGMGANKFHQRCRENSDLRPMFDSGEYDFNFIDKLIKTYRRTYSNIIAFWDTVEKCFKCVIKYPHEALYYPAINGFKDDRQLLTFWNQDGTVYIQLPSGRTLTYRHCRIARDGKYSVIKWQHGTLWGGGITENIVQAGSRDLLGYWILELEKAKMPVVMHAHDETISIVKDDEYAKHKLRDALLIMREGPDWSEGLPFDAEGELSKVYKK